jgi:hypothetical protein
LQALDAALAAGLPDANAALNAAGLKPLERKALPASSGAKGGGEEDGRKLW